MSDDLIRELREASEAAARGLNFLAWVDATDGARPLYDEWVALGEKDTNVALAKRAAANGEPIYVVACGNGYHESRESFLAAFADLVDSHRVGAEDLGTTRDLVWWARSDLHAREILQHIAEQAAAEIRVASPSIAKASRGEVDTAVLNEVSRKSADLAAALRVDVTRALDLARTEPERWATDREALVSERARADSNTQ